MAVVDVPKISTRTLPNNAYGKSSKIVLTDDSANITVLYKSFTLKAGNQIYDKRGMG